MSENPTIATIVADAERAAAHELINPEEAINQAANSLMASYRTICEQIFAYKEELESMGMSIPTESVRETSLQGAEPDTELANVPSGSLPHEDLTNMVRGYIAMTLRLRRDSKVVSKESEDQYARNHRFIAECPDSIDNIERLTLAVKTRWTAIIDNKDIKVRTKLSVTDEHCHGLYGFINDTLTAEEGDMFTPAEFRIRAAYDATAGRACPLTVGAIATVADLRDQLAYRAQELRDGAQDLSLINLV